MVTKKDRLAYDAKAKELVKQMSLDEKINLMSGNINMLWLGLQMLTGKGYNAVPYGAGGCKRLMIPPMLFCDGPRGVLPESNTCFPVTMARGASFDVELEESVGDIIGKEVRASGGNYFGGVCINLPYNPGWGRSQEVYGEDSVHMGKMGVALTKGVQGHNVMACIKHYAFNSMENARFKVSVVTDKRTEREVYLRHFKEVIDAGAASVMNAYNKYEGEHCGHSNYLLHEVLKGEWDFDGFVISDFMWGVRDTVGGINGGCDVEMCATNYYKSGKIKKEIKKGTIKEATIDEAAIRIVRTILAYTQAKDPQKYPKSLSACEEHLSLAQEVAEKSATLIKNDKQVLPFDRKKVHNIVLVGDLAAVDNTGDHGSSYLKRTKADNLVDVMKAKYGEAHVKFIPTNNALEAKELIQKADAVVFVVGMRHDDEGEHVTEYTKAGGDRQSLCLHPDEVRICEELGCVNPNTAVVLIGGNVIIMDPWIDKVPSALMTYYPGVRGAKATERILFGDVNPSGKLPFAVAKKETDYPKVNWDAEEQVYEYYHGYTLFDKEKIALSAPFGFGLSYTTFEFSDIKIEKRTSDEVIFSVMIKNSGDIYGGEVAQLYISWNGSSVHRPVKQLMDFKKVYLNSGESVVMQLSVTKEALAFYDEQQKKFVEENIEFTAYISNSSDISKVPGIQFEF